LLFGKVDVFESVEKEVVQVFSVAMAGSDHSFEGDQINT
jgi:hypothetical protein